MATRRNILIGAGALAVAGAGVAALSIGQMGSIDVYNAAVARSRAPLGQTPEIAELVRFATLAANSHNTQPWRFKISDTAIDILPDMTRRLSAVDPDDHHLFASLGCAAENLSIAAGLRGRSGTLGFDATAGGAVSFAFGDAASDDPALLDAVPKRQSTRGEYDGRPFSADELSRLAAATVEGVDLVLVTDRAQIDRIRDLVLAGNSRQLSDPRSCGN